MEKNIIYRWAVLWNVRFVFVDVFSLHSSFVFFCCGKCANQIISVSHVMKDIQRVAVWFFSLRAEQVPVAVPRIWTEKKINISDQKFTSLQYQRLWWIYYILVSYPGTDWLQCICRKSHLFSLWNPLSTHAEFYTNLAQIEILMRCPQIGWKKYEKLLSRFWWKPGVQFV